MRRLCGICGSAPMCYNKRMTPPPYGFQQPVSGGTFTVTLTLQSTATATAGPNGTNSNGTNSNGMGFLGSGICSAGVGPVTIGIHAQPYNMILSSYTDSSGVTHPGTDVDNVNGIITVHYSVSSTDGVLSHLASISAYETVDWSGNPAPPGAYPPGQYEPPCPPVQEFANPIQRYAYSNPDKEVSPYLVQGYLMDRFSPPSTGFASPLPFPSTTWSATQNYLFDDPQTGEVGTKIPGPDNKSPYTITRTVTPTNLAGTTGTYTVTTHGGDCFCVSLIEGINNEKELQQLSGLSCSRFSSRPSHSWLHIRICSDHESAIDNKRDYDHPQHHHAG